MPRELVLGETATSKQRSTGFRAVASRWSQVAKRVIRVVTLKKSLGKAKRTVGRTEANARKIRSNPGPATTARRVPRRGLVWAANLRLGSRRDKNGLQLLQSPLLPPNSPSSGTGKRDHSACLSSFEVASSLEIPHGILSALAEVPLSPAKRRSCISHTTSVWGSGGPKTRAYRGAVASKHKRCWPEAPPNNCSSVQKYLPRPHIASRIHH